MIYVCVICMVRRPPLSPLEAEHRTLLEAIVSPVINTEELKACHCQWLLCANCRQLMQTMCNFQQTALIGVKNLKALLHQQQTERRIVEDIKPMISIKIEPGHDVTPAASERGPITVEPPVNTNTPTDGRDVKLEPEAPEPEVELQCVTESTGNGVTNLKTQRIEQPATSITAPNTLQVQILPKMPGVAGSQWRFEVFSHKLHPSYNKPAARPSGARKEGARDAPQVKKKYKPVRVTCPHCGKSIRDSASLRVHITRLHSEEAPCKCDVCGKQCRNQMVLKYHKYHHREITKPLDSMRSELFCKECCLQFSSPSGYMMHLTTLKHVPREQYAFECETCKMKFVDEKRRQRHVEIVHLGQRTHKCDRCDKSFNMVKDVRKHIARVHEKRAIILPKHICHQCGKTFTARKSLDEHLLTHQGLRPHQCPLCPANFTYKAALYTHNRLKHLKIKGKWKKKKKVVEKEDVEKEASND